jgi:hypothetical protein
VASIVRTAIRQVILRCCAGTDVVVVGEGGVAGVLDFIRGGRCGKSRPTNIVSCFCILTVRYSSFLFVILWVMAGNCGYFLLKWFLFFSQFSAQCLCVKWLCVVDVSNCKSGVLCKTEVFVIIVVFWLLKAPGS